jgi:hypothetical protein
VSSLSVPIFVLGFLATPQEPKAAREWAQPHGNSASTSCVDVAPLKAPPTERWRLRSEKLLAGPVISQGKLFVARRDGGVAELVALDPATGAVLAKHALDGDAESLVAGDGLVVLTGPKSAAAWRLSGGELVPEKTIAGSFGGEPLLVGAAFLAPRADGGAQLLDWTAGKAAPLLAKGLGRPSVVDAETSAGESGPALVALVPEGADRGAVTRFALASTSPLKLGASKSLYSAGLVSASDAARTVLVAVAGREGSEWYVWYGGPRNSGVVRNSGFKLRELQHPPAAASGRLFGFDREDRLVEIDRDERNVNVLVEKGNLRQGARAGAPSIARDTLFLGNWAIETASKRVLWCLEGIEADGPAIPAGDELLVLRTKAQELVGFGNGKAGAAGATASSDAAIPAELPGKKPGLIRSDGRFVPGKVTALDQGRWRVEPEKGAPQELAADEVAFVDDGAKPRRIGEEHALFRACWSVLAPRHAERLVACFEKWRELKLHDECRRLVDEARAHGLPAARADELQGTIAGKGSAKLAATAPTRKKVQDLENEARVDSSDEIVKAAKWCARMDAKVAASALLSRAIELGPKGVEPDPDLAELADDWKPSTFPTELLAGAKVKSWLQWADALLPSGATFAVLDDSTARRMSVTKFAEKSLALRTRNILLFSKELDPTVLGPMLARGEATVRALQKILGPSPTGLPGAAPLEVRLHEHRGDYLADRIAGTLPMAWSAGCYSSADGISRFYSKQEGESGDPDGRTLHEVFAHELTHHYVDRRWVRDRPSASASYWMVEGFAEFVAGQALEIGRLGEKFDDATVLSIDKAAAAARVEQLIPLEYLLSLNGAHFHSELEGGAFGPVPLRHTLREVSLDKRGVFYAEATALTFFVMNRFGEKGRPTYLKWLQQVYGGSGLQEPWKDLGFEDVYAFRKAFREFLEQV